MAKDYFAILGVSKEATPEEIKRAYRKRARDLHPDVNPDPHAQEQFKEVSTAYEVLTDPEKRRIIDLGGDPYAPGGGMGGGAGGFSGFGGFGDIMDAFFGGGGGNTRQRRSRIRPGADALLGVELSLAEIAFGTTKEFVVDTAILCDSCEGAGTAPGTSPAECGTCSGTGEIQAVQRTMLGQMMVSRECHVCHGTGVVIPSPCQKCGGDGRVRSRRTVSAKVPAGVEDGMRIRLASQGEVGPGGGPPGDLYLEINQVAHDIFTREGDDLHCRVTLPMTSAALGTTLDLVNLDESVESLEIKAGTQPGDKITLRGKGVPRLRSTQRGSLIVHLEVKTPVRLDDEQEDLLRQLAKLRGEEGEASTKANPSGGLFSRMRDAFNGR
ncbi:molecular chaperone DnaJ [Antricoccus suffuscus]|uniref:Chaperone protein DnaJ n=1 Tax=Antricoccus suffuscus TaxID=1629062 RepID=A0A2T0Z4X2_9ACTN|nr:molecular chaperone DnaJ [Antricoccus suffuscus]PRZ31390.1 molecular chaperone DnaJ [Antricoccus suffuscus]